MHCVHVHIYHLGTFFPIITRSDVEPQSLPVIEGIKNFMGAGGWVMKRDLICSVKESLHGNVLSVGPKESEEPKS